MAKVETIKQLHLNATEMDILLKAKQVLLDIEEEDTGGEIFCQADNYESEWCWLIQFINNLIHNSEVE